MVNAFEMLVNADLILPFDGQFCYTFFNSEKLLKEAFRFSFLLAPGKS